MIKSLDQLPPLMKYRPGRVIIGIDPGVSGGVAVHYAGREVLTFPMPPEVDDVRDLFERITHPESVTTAYLEDVPPFAGKLFPGSRMFRLGESCGVIRGVLSALYINTVLVRPQAWQGALGLKKEKGMDQAAWKRALKEAAQVLYPDIKITLKTADAVLLMHYGLTQ
jgi:hypothetical protein|tara:strand:+ start:10068 stop:10568 length:501 start_codon:yes stop_codon:yes gene_type:complete